ncbi:MAG: hypothetical protein WCI20_13750 [bacterium]
MMIPIVIAEVSDKIPGKMGFVGVGLICLALVCLFAWQKWGWSMVLEFVVIGLGAWGLIQEFVMDNAMREAIIAEQGLSYYIIASVSLLVPVIVGTVIYILKRKQWGQQANST